MCVLEAFSKVKFQGPCNRLLSLMRQLHCCQRRLSCLQLGFSWLEVNFLLISNLFIPSFSLAVLPLSTKGRPDKATVPRIDGHSSLVTDFAFSPHDDGLLATGSQDQTVKIWRIPRSGLTSNLTVPEVSLGEQARRVETVSWHPTAEALLASSSGQGIALSDLTVGRQAWTYNGHADQVCPRSKLKPILADD